MRLLIAGVLCQRDLLAEVNSIIAASLPSEKLGFVPRPSL